MWRGGSDGCGEGGKEGSGGSGRRDGQSRAGYEREWRYGRGRREQRWWRRYTAQGGINGGSKATAGGEGERHAREGGEARGRPSDVRS